MNELGQLSRLTAVSAVSGGSLCALQLAVGLGDWFGSNPKPGSICSDFDSGFATPLRRLLSADLRTGALLLGWLDGLWSGRRRTTERLAGAIESKLSGILLSELPLRPHFIFGATHLRHGTGFVFSRDRIGDYTEGYRPAGSTKAALACAASAAFPPFFGPIRVGNGPALLDGGLYDNLALEPVWKSARNVLVSDAGRPLSAAEPTAALAVLSRSVELLLRQNNALRKRALFAAGRPVAYWSFDTPGSPGELREFSARVRTDLDGLRAVELDGLESCGYQQASYALKKHQVLPVPRTLPLSDPLSVQLLADQARLGKATTNAGRRRSLWERWR